MEIWGTGTFAKLIAGFDVAPAMGAKAIRIAKRREKMHNDVASWLFKEVYN